MPRISSINLRRGTTTAWTTPNPVLADGEIGWDSTVGKFKVGNGSSTWTALPYVLDSALSGKANSSHTHNATDINAGTLGDARLPSRLNINPQTITDWNSAISNGWVMGYNILNQPVPGTTWFIGEVIAHNNLYVTQEAIAFTSAAASNTQAYRRHNMNGTWGGWYKLMLSQTEQDARYIQLSQRAAANGVASLDATGKVPVAQIPGAQIPSFSGNYIERPAASAVVNGSVYYSIDTVEIYRSDGVFWQLVSGSGYSASAEITAQWTTNAVDLIDIPGLATAFMAGSGNTKITLSGEASHSVADGRIFLVIEINGTDYGHVALHFNTPDRYKTFSRTVMARNLVPGSYNTIKVKGMVHYATGGFGRLDAETYNPTLLLVEAL